MKEPDKPTYEQITPTLGLNLDERTAAENFLGKTREEAERMFCESAIHYGEDLMWMGSEAFRYYFPAFEAYVKSPASTGDWSAVTQLLITMDHRIKICGEQDLLNEFREVVPYCLANLSKFDLESDPALLDFDEPVIKARLEEYDNLLRKTDLPDDEEAK